MKKSFSSTLSIIVVLSLWLPAVAATPVEVLGCFLRGLIALLISLVSGLAALVAVIIGLKGRGLRSALR